jgi:hypothetical protein
MNTKWDLNIQRKIFVKVSILLLFRIFHDMISFISALSSWIMQHTQLLLGLNFHLSRTAVVSSPQTFLWLVLYSMANVLLWTPKLTTAKHRPPSEKNTSIIIIMVYSNSLAVTRTELLSYFNQVNAWSSLFLNVSTLSYYFAKPCTTAMPHLYSITHARPLTLCFSISKVEVFAFFIERFSFDLIWSDLTYYGEVQIWPLNCYRMHYTSR